MPHRRNRRPAKPQRPFAGGRSWKDCCSSRNNSASAKRGDDVAGTGDGAVLAPFLQRLPLVGDLVLAFLGWDEIVRIDVLQSDEHPADACLRGLLDEIRDLVAERCRPDGEADLRAIAGAQASRSTSSKRPSSPSPAKNEMPSACASRKSCGISGNMAMQPEMWKPPTQTGSPAARNGRARSTARGNWLDCTPTRPISALPPALRIIRMIRSGRMRRLVSA